MLPKKHRLNKGADISRVLKTGIKNTSRHLLIVHKTTSRPKPTRITCVVSKKVHPSSVKRHRYQRWMRQLAHHIITQHPTGIDMVLIAKPTITSVKNSAQLQAGSSGKLEEILTPPK